MEERKQNNNEQTLGRAGDDKYTGGRQGVDKDPAEDGANANVQFEQESQKGKQQVDADVTNEEDRSNENQEL